MARLAQYTEEYDVKMRTEVKDKDEEINMLQANFNELEQRHNSQMTQVQHELSMK